MKIETPKFLVPGLTAIAVVFLLLSTLAENISFSGVAAFSDPLDWMRGTLLAIVLTFLLMVSVCLKISIILAVLVGAVYAILKHGLRLEKARKLTAFIGIVIFAVYFKFVFVNFTMNLKFGH